MYSYTLVMYVKCYYMTVYMYNPLKPTSTCWYNSQIKSNQKKFIHTYKQVHSVYKSKVFKKYLHIYKHNYCKHNAFNIHIILL